MLRRFSGRGFVVHNHGVEAFSGRFLKKHDRNALAADGKLRQLVDIRGVFLRVAAGGEQHAVRAETLERLNRAPLFFKVLPGFIDGQRIPVLRRRRLHAAQHARKEHAHNRRNNHAERIRLSALEAAGKGVCFVLEFVHRLQNPCAQLVADALCAVEHVGNRGNGNAGIRRNIHDADGALRRRLWFLGHRFERYPFMFCSQRFAASSSLGSGKHSALISPL